VEVIHRAVTHGAKIYALSPIDSLQRVHCFLRENKYLPEQFVRDRQHILVVGLADDGCVARSPGISDEHALEQLIFKEALIRAVAIKHMPMLPVIAGGTNTAVNQRSRCQFHIFFLSRSSVDQNTSFRLGSWCFSFSYAAALISAGYP
jgi:hypothetical protein